MKSRRHMKLMLRWLKERQQVKIQCVQPASSEPSSERTVIGSEAEALAAAAAAEAATATVAGGRGMSPVKRRGPKGQKAVSQEREFVYSVIPKHMLKKEPAGEANVRV